MDAPDAVGGAVQEAAAGGARRPLGLLHAQLPGYGAGDDLAVLGGRDGEGLAREPNAVAGGEDLGVAGAQLLVDLHVARVALDPEAPEERVELLLADGLDDLVGGQHEVG